MKLRSRSIAAFSLVEVTLALGVAAFCLIAVFGLVPVGVQTNRHATSQTVATNILSSVVSDIRASQKGSSLTAKYKIRRGKGNPTWICFDRQGQPDGAGQLGNVAPPCRPGNWYYRLSVKIYPVTTPLVTVNVTYADLKLSWPAVAPAVDPLITPVTPSGSVETVTSFFDN